MNQPFFTQQILSWYKQNLRDLPWRSTKDPYKIWLSEIILQQTRVSQGTPYYLSFVDKFPTVNHLAKASEDEVLRTWQGLGYYSRARNLHKCAQIITGEMEGQFPNKYSELLKLPGIGPYTAAAVASICFNVPEPAIDGNVIRVISRFMGIDDDVAMSSTLSQIRNCSSEFIDTKQPSDYNQAVMEFGATMCTPKSPSCESCPLASNCLAFQAKVVSKIPFNSKKVAVKHRYFNYIVINSDDKRVYKKRGTSDIWGGLYDFPMIESSEKIEVDATLSSLNIGLTQEPRIEYVSDWHTHILSHQKLHARFITVSADEVLKFEEENLALYTDEEAEQLPKPTLITNYLKNKLL